MLTDRDFIAVGKEFPPKPERKRLDDIKLDRKLFDGEHGDVFAEAFRRIQKMSLFEHRSDIVILNWCEKVPLVFADLLVGEPAPVHAVSTDEQSSVDSVVRSLKLMRAVHEGTVEIGAVGDAVYKLDPDGSRLRPVPAEFWFPVVSPADTREIVRHVIAWTYNAGTEDHPDWRGTGEIHDPGYVTPVKFRLDSDRYGKMTITSVTLGESVSTGVDVPLVFHVPNPKRSVRKLHGKSDISSMQSLVAELEVRFAGVSKVLDKHTDPTAYGPEAAQAETQDGAVYYEPGNYIALPDKDTPTPGYATWDAQMQATFGFLDRLIEQLYMDTETCPALFGRIDSGQGVTESASALKRLLIRPLAKINRLRMAWEEVLPDIIHTAAALRGEPVGDIRIDWKDGIPDDPEETARTEELLRRSGVRSVEASVRNVTGLTGEELDREVERIKTEGQVDAPEVGVMLPEVV